MHSQFILPTAYTPHMYMPYTYYMPVTTRLLENKRNRSFSFVFMGKCREPFLFVGVDVTLTKIGFVEIIIFLFSFLLLHIKYY